MCMIPPAWTDLSRPRSLVVQWIAVIHQDRTCIQTIYGVSLRNYFYETAFQPPRCARDCPCALSCRSLRLGSVRLVVRESVPCCDRTIVLRSYATSGIEPASSQFLAGLIIWHI